MAKRNPKEVEAIVSAMGVFTTLITNLVELVKKLGGTVENIYRLATPEGRKTLEAIAQLIVNGAVVAKNEFLRIISGGQSLVIDAVDGSKIIAKAKKTFPAGIDSDFVRWSADEPGQPTPETVASVYEMARDATFSQMLGSLSADISKLCFTQHQIINFVEKHFNWLRTGGYATFLPFVSYGHFFVAGVDVHSDGGLGVSVRRFGDGCVWGAGGRHRVVVPQLA